MFTRLARPSVLSAVALLLAAIGTGIAASADRTQLGDRTALDRYVKAPDTNYSFRLANTIKGEGYTVYVQDVNRVAFALDGVGQAEGIVGIGRFDVTVERGAIAELRAVGGGRDAGADRREQQGYGRENGGAGKSGKHRRGLLKTGLPQTRDQKSAHDSLG